MALPKDHRANSSSWIAWVHFNGYYGSINNPSLCRFSGTCAQVSPKVNRSESMLIQYSDHVGRDHQVWTNSIVNENSQSSLFNEQQETAVWLEKWNRLVYAEKTTDNILQKQSALYFCACCSGLIWVCTHLDKVCAEMVHCSGDECATVGAGNKSSGARNGGVEDDWARSHDAFHVNTGKLLALLAKPKRPTRIQQTSEKRERIDKFENGSFWTKF